MTDTNVTQLIINKLTKAQYDALQDKSETELYLVPDEIDDTPTSGSENPVTSDGIKTALDTKQDKLESGTSIKTINNQSVLGNGNLDVKDVFLAEYGITTFSEIQAAIRSKKVVIVHDNDYNEMYYFQSLEGHDDQWYNFICYGFNFNIKLIRCIIHASDESTEWEYVTDLSKVTSISQASTDTQYPTAKAVYDFVQSSTQPQTAIYNVQPNTTTLDAVVDTYYNFFGTVNSCTITLPLMTTATTTLKNIIFNLTCGDTPAIVINGAEVTTDETQDVVYFANYLIEANKSYEINALWNGSKWVIGAAEITIPTEVEEVEE